VPTSAKLQRLILAVVVLCGWAGCYASGAPQRPPTETGTAVYYSDKMDGRRVFLKGERYNKNALTAATHSRYSMGSMLRVTNLSNGRSVTVRVNDRMSPRSKATIDLSRKAAEEIGMIKSGHAKVKIELVQAK